jgi:hypothetical protein
MHRYAEASPHEDVDGLLEGVRRALRYSLAHPGRDREAAFSLLAADGLLTLVVERLADADDPEARIRALVAELAADAAVPGPSSAGGGSGDGRSG